MSIGKQATWRFGMSKKALPGSWGDSGSFAGFCVWSHDSNQIAFSWEVYSPKESRTELRVVSLEADSSPETISLPEATNPSWIYDARLTKR